MRFAPRSSGLITSAFNSHTTKGAFVQNLFVKLFKSLAPGRAAGGLFKNNARPQRERSRGLTRFMMA